MAQYSWQTCQDDVRQQIMKYGQSLQQLLGDELVGVYLHGSLAMGCFNPTGSDIDLLIVTQNPLTLSQQHGIGKLTLSNSLNPIGLELSSLAQEYLTDWEHPCRYDYHYGEDWREKLLNELTKGSYQNWSQPMGKDGDLAGHVMIVRHRGIVLVGKPILDVFPIIPIEDYQASIMSDYHWLLDKGLGNSVYGILNMCRIWQHFKDGAISSKDEGGVWTLDHLPTQHHEIVTKALASYRHDAPLNIDESDYDAFKTYVAAQLGIE